MNRKLKNSILIATLIFGILGIALTLSIAKYNAPNGISSVSTSEMGAPGMGGTPPDMGSDNSNNDSENTPPEIPSGENSGSSGGETPPELPGGGNSDGGTPSELPDSESGSADDSENSTPPAKPDSNTGSDSSSKPTRPEDTSDEDVASSDSNTSSTSRPEKPMNNSEDGAPEMAAADCDAATDCASASGSLDIPYIVVIAICSLIISLDLLYLIMSGFGKNPVFTKKTEEISETGEKSVKKSAKGANITIYVLANIILTASITILTVFLSNEFLL